MSPVLPREERDAIRAALGRGWVRCDVCIGVSPSWDGHEPGCSEWARERLTALLDALDAAEEEARRESNRADQWQRAHDADVAEAETEADAARAEVAALRGRIEALANEWERTTTQSLAASGYTYSLPMRDVLVRLRRALAADEGERTGR